MYTYKRTDLSNDYATSKLDQWCRDYVLVQPCRLFQHQHVAALFFQSDGVRFHVPDDFIVTVFVHSQQMGVVLLDGYGRRSAGFRIKWKKLYEIFFLLITINTLS